MMPGWWSQPYRPDGSAAADGIGKQLGTPSLDSLVVLLRETAQNSWDARPAGDTSITVRYAVEQMGDARAAAFAALLLPGPAGDVRDLASAVGADSTLLVVSDRGTCGLGGPTRSDVDAAGQQPDFVNFVRNVGEARDRELGGGTYGFGKGALYRVSSVGTLVVHTACRTATGIERRLMAASLGHSFVSSGLRFTGRHWWGDMRDGVIEPLIHAEAARVAERLGLLGFADGETGTDVYVLGAQLGDHLDGSTRSRSDGAVALASAALWYLWPKLLDRPGRPRMDLSVMVDGVAVAIPRPADVSALYPFVAALEAIDRGAGTIHRRRQPNRDVGYFAVEKDIFVGRADPVVDAVAPFDGPAHHCVRMRDVELVVDYLAGDPLPDPYQYGAVFRTTPDKVVDECFAAAEPPTHDAWVFKPLTGVDRGTVEGAVKFIRSELARFVAPAAPTASSDVAAPVGALSHALAGLLAAAAGDGGGSDQRGGGGAGGGGGGGARSSLRLDGPAHLVVRNGEALVAQRLVLQADLGVRIEASGIVAVDGGSEREAPEGAPLPQVVGWEAVDGSWNAGSQLSVTAGGPLEWTVFVRPAGDSATIVRVREVSS